MTTAKPGADSATSLLPDLEDGELAVIESIEVKERKTKPPALYTEGTLLDDMKAAAKFVEDDPVLKKMLREASGLGTAATRDSIIEGLKHDKYIEKSGKNLVATAKGEAFILWLESFMPELTDVALTARWEAELSLVAQQGGGKAFEARVTDSVKKLISILKTAHPLGVPSSSSSTSKESSSMSDTTPQRANKPTDKMLEFAKNVAKRIGVRVPDEVMTDFDACREFLDTNKDAAMRPSDKQLNFAKSIAERKGVDIPEDVMANGRELSKWIDEHK